MECPQKIYPSSRNLRVIKNKVHCSEKDCQSSFKSGSNLNLHLIKTHKKQELAKSRYKNVQFHCPINNCVYNTQKSFRHMKLIKQHFIKMHSEKDFKCVMCGKGFGTETACKAHREYCQTMFKCMDCEAVYSYYESLQTHARRKKHKILNKVHYKSQIEVISNFTIKFPEKSDGENGQNGKKILPKPNLYIVHTSNTSKQKGNIQKSIETQTENFVKDSITQTTDYGEIYSNSNDLMNLNELNTTKTTLGTQTLSLDNLIDTESDSLSYECSGSQTMCEENNLLGNYFSMETQTDIFDCLLPDFCSNSCTQTYEDTLINNDIHTQTMFSDLLRSVGSQTLMSSTHLEDLEGLGANGREISDIQTQTDLAFKEIFGDIVPE